MTQTRGTAADFPEFGEVTVEQVERACAAAVAECDAIVARVGAVGPGGRTAENTLLALEDAEDAVESAIWGWAFHRHVAADEAVRAAARDGYTRLNQRLVALRFDDGLRRAVEEFAATPEAAALTGEARRRLEHSVRDGRRDGFGLPEAERLGVRRLFDELAELETEFQRGIADWKGGIEVTRAELAGVPQSFVDGLERVGDDRYRVTLEHPHLVGYGMQADCAAKRQELWEGFYRKGGPENVVVLERMLAVRERIALALGYDSWAAYQVEPRMAGRREAVEEFLADLWPRLAEKAAADLAEFAGALRETGQGGELAAWDHDYGINLLKRVRHELDEAGIAAYFPLESVLDGMLTVTGELFGVRFDAVPDAAVWDPDVLVYDVTDTDGGTGEPFARFFLDLFPRPGKYPHAAVAQMVKGRRLPDGSYRAPVAMLVANLPRPRGDRPSLLAQDDVETLFHEFGHVLHKTLARPELPSFSSGQCEREFVEAPSQMLEHWIWNAEVLARFTRHHATGEPLPRATLERMVAARNAGSGLVYLRRLHDSRVDFAMHSPGFGGDSTATARAVEAETGYAYPPRTHFQGGWTHMVRLDAGYYGYLWSQALGDDMYTVFEQAGPFDRAAGRRLRRLVLEPGATRDAAAMVRDFLGREPGNAAFLRHMGLTD